MSEIQGREGVNESYTNQMFFFRPFNETLQSLRSTGALDFYTPMPQIKPCLLRFSHLEQFTGLARNSLRRFF